MKGNDVSVAGKDEKPAKKKAVGKRVPVAPARKRVAKKGKKTNRRGAKVAEENAEKDKGGRPTLYSLELLDVICERLGKGEPLALICREQAMPARNTVWRWAKESEEVSERIACARDEGFDTIALEILTIADNTGHEDKDTIATDFGPIPDKEWILRSKLRCEMRLKLLSKWDPKRYGDKMTTEISGPEGGPIPIQPKERSDEEMRAFAEMLAAADRAARPPAA
jgi:hypothetical protein